MAHCPYKLLEDLEPTLDEIRKLPKIKEMKPGIFYLKSRGFLHFHINKENERWADIHDGKAWCKGIVLPFNPSKKILSSFAKAVESNHAKIIK